MTDLRELRKLGQSPWLDELNRDILLSGQLRDLIEREGVTGVTSDPTIFEKALAKSQVYDNDIQRLSREGRDSPAIYEELLVGDVTQAADCLLNVYHDSKFKDGFVCFELPPSLANDLEATVAEAKRLVARIGKPNLMVKVPATREGIEAVHRLTAEGVNVNATLIFSQEQYAAVADAYMCGLRDRIVKHLPLNEVTGAASLFVGRLDSYIDRLINDLFLKEQDPQVQAGLEKLVGRAGVSEARIIYDLYRRIFFGLDFSVMESKEGNIQRLLLGSTANKNPSYSDTKYVDELIGERTINTMTLATIEAFKDHGEAKPTLDSALNEAKDVISSLQANGISIEELGKTLLSDGLSGFAASYAKSLRLIDKKKTL